MRTNASCLRLHFLCQQFLHTSKRAIWKRCSLDCYPRCIGSQDAKRCASYLARPCLRFRCWRWNYSHYCSQAIWCTCRSGVEYNEKLAILAQANALRSGVGDRVKIIQGDIFVEDFSKASVVTLYLLEELNAKLRPQILKMQPGTRVVSNTFSMGDWEPDQVIDSNGHTAYLWRVPAQVGGGWTVSGLASDGKSHTSHIHFDQRHQRCVRNNDS